MLKDFVSNGALLIASFSIMGVLFKDKPLHTTSPLPSKIYWGLCFGVLGNILMAFSIQINSSTIADLRHLAIVIAATFGGYIPALIAAVFIAAGRILLFGINESSLLDQSEHFSLESYAGVSQILTPQEPLKLSS
jgi:hypothetical protein